MGVYINMEMPKETPVLFCVHPDGKVFADLEGEWREYKAVPVPPHGDLIDRKTAYDSLLNGMVMTGYQSRALDCINGFYVTTIIEAEEGE